MHGPSLRWLALFLALMSQAGSASSLCPPAGEAARALEAGRTLVEQALDERDRAGFDRGISEIRRADGLAPGCSEVRRALAAALWNGALRLSLATAPAEALLTEARSVLEAASAAAPADVDLVEDLATFAADDRERLRWLRRMVEMAPDHPRAHRGIAIIALGQGDVDRAVAEYSLHLKFAVYEGRESGAQHTSFALDLIARGRAADASVILEQTLKLAAGESDFERCWLVQPFAGGPLASAPAIGETIRGLLPYCTRHEHRDRGAALERSGRIEDAMAEYRAQLEENPAFEETYLSLERLLREQGQWTEGATVVEKLLSRARTGADRCRFLKQIDADGYQAHGLGQFSAIEKQCPPALPAAEERE